MIGAAEREASLAFTAVASLASLLTLTYSLRFYSLYFHRPIRLL